MRIAGHLLAGKRAEAIAEKFLIGKGMRLITRNFRCKLGEIDLVMRDKQALVFVEVRYRKNKSFGLAQETVSLAKQRKLGRTATVFLLQNDLYDTAPCRFDIIAIHGTIPGQTVEWIADAFRSA